MDVVINILLSIVIFIFLIGLVVFIHELGHFLMAKRAGVFVQEFAFGFGRALWKKRIKGTDYRINIFPLGGYVKMLGDQDGSSFLRYTEKPYNQADKKFALELFQKNKINPKTSSFSTIERFGHKMQKDLTEEEYGKLQNYLIYDYIPNHPGNFDNISLRNRVLVISAGVIMNFLLAIVLFYLYFIFAGFFTDVRKIGDPIILGANVSNPPYLLFLEGTDNEIYADSLIIKADGNLVNSEQEFLNYINSRPNQKIKLDIMKLTESSYSFESADLILNGDGIKSNFDSDVIDRPLITNVTENSLASIIGLKTGDYLISLAGIPLTKDTDLGEILNSHLNSIVELEFMSDDARLIKTEAFIKPNEEGKALLGITYYRNDSFPDILLRVDYSNNKALSGVSHAINMTIYNFTGLNELVKQSLKEKSIEPVSSGISSIVGVSDFVYNLVKVDDFVNIINLTALVSLSLGVMNILPIPLFDGGHLFFMLLEKIRGKKMSDVFQERISTIAFYSLIAISAIIIFKDFWQINLLDRISSLLKTLLGY